MDEQPTPDELQARLIGRAWDDDEFKQRLMSDPKATICEELGVELPDDMEIQVMEETPDKICLVLPVRPEAVSGDALSDEELESVAGGIGGGGGTAPYYTTPNAGITRLAVVTPTMPRFRGR